MSRHFGELRGPEVAGLSPDAVAVLPIGSIEQHGPHLPVNTDLIIAHSLVRDSMDAFGDALDLWQLPELGYSKSNEHAWSPGTMWLSATTLLAVLDDLARCLATTPLRRLVFLNGHGGNSALLQVAARDIRLAHGLRTFVMHPSLPADHGGTSPAAERGMGIHAGIDETSLLLHLRPELVRLDLAVRSVPEQIADYQRVRFGGAVSFGWLSDDFGTDGTIGDPTGATAERGKALYTAMLATAGESFAEIARFDPRPRPGSTPGPSGRSDPAPFADPASSAGQAPSAGPSGPSR
ncbi:creatininase family protein [Frankia sp. Ag45/Mut15]|uniref:Creatininase family protein n=1 Tax=Frankia umida TaxID=573489 RepID=A0ABT0K1W4_9ACTN|nr:creatininase family protein [Frankia umida]MCK9877524.1 creatininase family protein [Frankia umida]